MQSLMWDSLGEGRECCERQTETETDREVIGWRSGDSVGTRAEFNIQVVMTCIREQLRTAAQSKHYKYATPYSL